MNHSYQKTLACFLLAVMGLALYYPVTGHDFLNMDDPFFVEQHHVPDGITLENIKRAFTLHYGMWMPVTWLSHMADAQLYDLRPTGHHLTSLFIHLANTLLLFIVLRAMTGAFYKSLIVAAIFLFHPLNVESMAYIACRKGLLATFFWLLTILAYTRYSQRPSIKSYLLMSLYFLLGLMAKPILVTLPLILLLLDYWPLNRSLNKNRLRLIVEKLPLLAVSVIFGLITIFTQNQAEALSTLSEISLSDRMANALVNYMVYLGHAFWPSGLTIFYPWPQNLPLWKAFAAGTLLLIITINIIDRRQESPYAITGWLWFIITLLPVIGIIPVGSHGMADRYAYLPGIGILIIIVWTTSSVFKGLHINKPLITLFVLLLLVASGTASRHQLHVWINSESVFRHALTVTTGNYAAHNNLARALMDKGEMEEARIHLNRALDIHPEFPQANNNLGVLLASENQTDRALTHFSRAIQYRPNLAEAHYNMANILLTSGSSAMALTHYRQALESDPDYIHAADIYHRIGLILKARKLTRKAAETFQKALSLDPGHTQAAGKLAQIYKAKGRYDMAISIYRQLLQNRPDCDISISYNLACLNALKNNPAEAITWLKRSIENGFSHYEFLKTDNELENIRQLPEFKDLVQKP